MPDPTRADARLTPRQIRTMTEEQILAYWRSEQHRKRAAGEPHYDRLIDPVTGDVVACTKELL